MNPEDSSALWNGRYGGNLRRIAGAPRLLIAGFASILGVAAFTGCQQKAATPPQMPPPDVLVVNVEQKDIPIYGDWVATLDGYVNAQIQPQVSGYLVRQTYREGSNVRKGDVLFEIDPRPFRAALDQAKGQLSQAQGQLAQGVAQLGLAEINVKRDTPLAQAHAIATSQLDNDTQTRATAQATVQTNKAGIESAQAAVETAELNLGFTKVTSLIDGVAGIATVQAGNLVNPTSVLTTVSQVNPIKAYFPISEQEYMRVAGDMKSGSARDWLRRAADVPLQLKLADGSIYPERGHIVFTDRQVDPQTGTIRIVGAFANRGNILRPGQFGRIRARTGVMHNALLIPQRAVSEMQGRYLVDVVGSDNKVAIRNVKVGPRVGSMWVIEQGIGKGDRIISEGLEKVRDGAPVNAQPDKTPADESTQQQQ